MHKTLQKADGRYGICPGYVITADLVYEIAAGAAMKPNNHRLFKLEDIAMGSWIDYIQAEKGIRVRYARPILESVPLHPGTVMRVLRSINLEYDTGAQNVTFAGAVVLLYCKSDKIRSRSVNC